MNKKLKASLITISSILGVLVLTAASYAGYVIFSYNRIEDNLDLTVNSNASNEKVTTGETYKMTSYNIGFGAYSQDFTFFLDTGYDENGNATCGHYSKAFSKEDVLYNVNGAANTIKSLDVDFALFQEVDTDSTRSYHVDESAIINDAFASYDNTFAVNFHSAFLAYPFYDMHGKSNAGIETLSKYKIQKAVRKSYTISTSFSKFFDLDRCFSYAVVEVDNGKSLYIVNSHMSAYDTGGVIREKQVNELNEFLIACQNEGDYVIVGGDFNHDLLTYNPEYDYTPDNDPFNNVTKTPDWVAYMFKEDKTSPYASGYTIIASDNHPTCRNNDIAYEKGKTYVCTIDGFIVSSNIKVTKHENIETTGGKLGEDGFAYADHDPAYMEFELL